MQYKYYIYQQNPGNNDKFDLSNYTLVREFFPCGQWELHYKPHETWLYVNRWEFNGQLHFRGDDYNAIMAIVDDCRQLYIKITVKCDGVWSDHWSGFFSKYDMIVDEDNCIVSIRPSVADRYNSVLNKLKTKFNVYDVPNIYTAIAIVYGYPLEYYIPPRTITFGFPPITIPPVWHEATVGGEYYLYQLKIYPQVTETGFQTGDYWTERFYAREWITDTSNVPPDPSWTLLEESSPGVFKFIRPVGNSIYQNYTQTVDGDIETWTLQGYSTAVGSAFDIRNCKKVFEVFEYWLDPLGVTFSSLLLSDPNPMGGNPLNDLMIVSSGEMYHFDDMTVKQEITMEQFLLNLMELIPVQWHIDDSGVFHLEHISYYVNNLSYVGPPAVTLDLTLPQYAIYVKGKNKYNYKDPPNYVKEEWNVVNNNNTDFIGEDIIYECNIEGVTTHNSSFSTDMWWLYVHRNELPRDGWILLHTYYYIPNAAYRVYNETGYITGLLMSNAHLAVANLHERYWTWDRYFPTGRMNGRTVTFESWDMRKLQEEITIPYCCGLDITGTIRTPLGDGKLEEAVYEAKSGTIKLKLKYE